MAGYSFANRSRDQRPSNEFLGNIVLKIEEFDHARNAATGVTRDGEVMTIRLANKAEFADMFVNRTKFTTQDARERVAAQQTGNRPGTATLAQKMEPGEGAIQFQSVKKTPQGELVARWMESVSTTADDTYVNAQVRIPIPRSNQETAGQTDRRRADVVLESTATAATMDALDAFTANRVAGDDRKRLDGEVRSAVLVAVQVAEDPSETPTNYVWTSWDAEAKSFKSGGRELFDRPLNEHTWETMVPLAAQVGIPFEEITFDEKRINARDRQQNAPALYDATKAGHIKVALAQGFTAEVMPRLTGEIVKSESQALESEGRRAAMSDRGFFAADIGLRSREGQPGYGAQVSVKQILPNEFLHPRASESYSVRSLEALGQRVIAAAEAAGEGLTMRPAPKPTAEAAPEPTPPRKVASLTPDL